jgi:hypothetical protein
MYIENGRGARLLHVQLTGEKSRLVARTALATNPLELPLDLGSCTPIWCYLCI